MSDNEIRMQIVPPPESGCLCEATDYESVGPCPLPGHDSRTKTAADESGDTRGVGG